MKKQPRRGSILLEATVAVVLTGAALLLLATLIAALRANQRDLNRRSAALHEAANMLELARASVAWPALPEYATADEQPDAGSQPPRRRVQASAGAPLIDLVPDARIEIVLTPEADLADLQRIQITVFGGRARGNERTLAELTGWRRSARKDSR